MSVYIPMQRSFQIHSNQHVRNDRFTFSVGLYKWTTTTKLVLQDGNSFFIYYTHSHSFLPYYSYLELATVLCLHLNGILIDPPYLWDTFAAPSKRAREIDFVEVSEAKRYPSELIIVQNLHGTRTVGYHLLLIDSSSISGCDLREKIPAFSQNNKVMHQF